MVVSVLKHKLSHEEILSKDSSKLHEDIRVLVVRERTTLKAVYEQLKERKNLTTSYQNFVQRLTAGSLVYEHLLEVADILGYELTYKKKPKAE